MTMDLIITILALIIAVSYVIYLNIFDKSKLAAIALQIVTFAELQYENNEDKKNYAIQQLMKHIPATLLLFLNEKAIVKYLDDIVETAVTVLKTSISEDSSETIKKLIKELKK